VLSTSRRPLRASDAEREEAVAELRSQYAAGRLSEEELAERCELAYVTASRHGLAALLADMPPPPRRGRARWLARAERANARALHLHAGTYASVQGSALGIWVLTGEGAFWPAWLLVPGTVLLGWHAVFSRRLSHRLRAIRGAR
jgi:Domain of unknown function (DUF1707)